MPPATRREVRLSASLPHPSAENGDSQTMATTRSANFVMPNMDSILENFEHFKRKHISQNREIIKANAVAQTRMRELENRIQTLEAEKVQKEMETVGLAAQLAQLRHAIRCIHAGWETIGRGLSFGPIDPQTSFDPSNIASTSRLPPSNRVKVEPNPNAGAVVKHVATAPGGHIGCLPEEASHAEADDDPPRQSLAAHANGSLQAVSAARQQFNDWQHQFKALHPYLPSEANSEAMDGVLAYRGQDEPPTLRSGSNQNHPPPLVDITNGGYASTSPLHSHVSPYLDNDARAADSTPRKARGHSHDSASASHFVLTTSVNPPPSEARTPGGRKRKIPAHEPHDSMPTPARLFSAAIEATPSTAAAAAGADPDSEPQTGRTRRVRKSINYALPKLNTKMRKPDPGDLVPASTPHRSNSNTPASARGMVGSTGNLSDIRKLHEAAALRQSPAERTSNMRSKCGPGRDSGEMSRGDENGGAVRMADLFEIRQHANHLADRESNSNGRSNSRHAFWSTDGITDTSDDESRVTSNADIGELAELEAAINQRFVFHRQYGILLFQCNEQWQCQQTSFLAT
ncbi:hypothetical protein NDA16_005183 [Ustilago loliicola]|nr:hypothetical protein NDA16_005183 [Ustilago loliicola]